MARPAGSASAQELIYGVHAVREALRAGSRPLIRLLITHQDGRFSELVRLAREARVPIHTEPRVALDRLVPSGKHQGIVALVAAKDYCDLDEVLAHARQRGEAPLIVVLDGVEDPHNLGAVLRSAEAAGVHGVVVPDRRAVGLTATVAKASAGALEYLRIARAGNMNRALEALKAAEIWVYGFEATGAVLYTELDYRSPMALVFGGEGKGLRQSVREKCDAVGRLPMRGRVSSLNISAAATAVLFEAVRQRHGAPGRDPISGAG